MLPWQKAHIQRHESALVENVECSSKLIANLLETGDLSDSEFTSLHTSKDQSSRLYETLQFSAKGYETLTRAAYECKQNKMLKILLNGLRNQGIRDPLTQSRIPISISAIQSTDIWIKGSKSKVENVFSETDLSTLEEIISDNYLEEDYIDTFITGDKRLEFPATIPPKPPIYIPRLVSNRLKLNPKIFKKNMKDLFVFKGLKLHELTNLANTNHITTFRRIAENQKVDKNIRFVWLDNDYQSAWEEIRKLSGLTPVHLVKVEVKGNSGLKNIKDGQYILKATSNFKSILKWVGKQHRKAAIYTEEDKFVKIITNNQGNPGFCICDTPGMGKSYLLESLARKVQESHPDWVVVYVKLSNFIKDLKGQEMRLRVNPEIAPNLILEHITPSQILVNLLVETFTRGSKRLELFLDGLDELTSDEDLKLMKMFLKAILKFQTGRGNVYATARPHVKADLEKTLQVAAYDILPFSFENQIEFLEKSWKRKNEVDWKILNAHESNLEGLAKSCLERIEKILSEKRTEIMGIPLKCFLLAGIHEQDAKRVLSIGVLEDNPIIKNYSIYDLLEKYIDTRKSSRSDCNWENVKNFHVWKALEIQVGCEFANKYADFKKIEIEFPEKCYSFGILTKSANGPIFIHQTFIEFFVILGFGDLIQSACLDSRQSWLWDMIKRLAKDIVFKRNYPETTTLSELHSRNTHYDPYIQIDTFTFQNQVHLYFFNKYLCNNEDSLYPLTSNKTLAAYLEFMYKEAYSIIQCCIDNYYIYILRFVKNIFQNGWEKFQSLAEPSTQFFTWSTWTPHRPIVLLILLAARTSSVEIMRELEGLLESCKCKLSQVQFNVSEDVKLTPLQIAVESGNNELFLHHLKNYSYDPKELLLSCTYNTLGSDSYVVKEKQEICEFLISNMSNLIMNIEDAIYMKKVHPDLISFLLDKLHNPKSNAGRSGSRLIKLIKNVIFEYSSHINDSLLRKMLESSSFPLKLIDERIREEDEESGDNLLLALVRRKRGPVVLQTLEVERLINNFKNQNVQNALHVAAKTGNMDVVEYLHSKGVSLEEYDREGNTPILLAYQYLKVIECFLKVGANAAVINTKNKKNLLHLMSTNCPDHEEYIEEHLSTVKDLIDRDIDVNAKDTEGQFPLLSYLINKYMSSTHYARIADLLLKHGANIHAVDNKGNNLLFWGAYLGRSTQILEYLEEKGAKWKDVLNNSNDTIFHMAARGGNYKFLRSNLSKLDSEAVEKVNNERETPLLSAMAFKQGYYFVLEMINLFADENADLGAIDKEGNNAIFLATYHGQDEKVLKLLLEKNVDSKCRNQNGDCILHMAAKTRNYEGLNYFLLKSNCVDINAKNNEGKTPFLSAFTRTSGDTEDDIRIHGRNVKTILDLLKRNWNFDINAVDNDGNNALHLAVISELPTELMRHLEILGCDPETPNNNGQTFNQLFNISMENESFRRSRDLDEDYYLEDNDFNYSDDDEYDYFKDYDLLEDYEYDYLDD